MGEGKEHQPPLSVDDQIKNLIEIGLVIENKDTVSEVLNEISYYRLIKAFSLRLKTKKGRYYPGITFEHLLGLYEFNVQFRHLLFPEIEKIEVMMRCRLANYFSMKYGVIGYLDGNNFSNSEYHKAQMREVEEELRKNAKNPFVKNFQNNYVNGYLPFYALVEIFSFGTLSKFYKNMKPEDKKAIARTFGIGYTYLESWLESLSYVRNICAHYGRLYNAKLSKTPRLYKEYAEMGIGNNRVFAVLLCMKHLQRNNSHWSVFIQGVCNLFENYEAVDKSTMGFPDQWMEIMEVRL